MKGLVVAVCILVLVVMGAQVSHGTITCNQVAGSLGQCMGFLTGKVGAPPGPCCAGIRNLKALAATTADRRQACACMMRTANSMKNLKDANAKNLPRACGVNLSFTVSRNINCNQIP